MSTVATVAVILAAVRALHLGARIARALERICKDLRDLDNQAAQVSAYGLKLAPLVDEPDEAAAP